MSITEVAKLAGVSTSTVSRVINNHPRVAPETVAAVRKAMDTLSYTPSDRRPGPKPASRNRATVGSIAFLAFGTSRRTATPGFGELLRGVSQGASQNGLSLTFAHVATPSDIPARTLDGVKGLLLHGNTPPEPVRERMRQFPTVWLMGNRNRPTWGDQVMPDGYSVGVHAARYLLGRGHKRLAFLNLDADHWSFRLYAHAFATTVSEAGGSVELLEERQGHSDEYWEPYRPETVDRLIRRFRALKKPPTGIFVADDIQVARVQPALQAQGVKIGPGHTEIIACNNEEPYLVGLQPRPAVIDIRIEAIGRRGVEQLMWRMERPNVPERICTTIEPYVVEPQLDKAPA